MVKSGSGPIFPKTKMNLKKTILISILFHLVILLPWFVWKHKIAPLSGGGGGLGESGSRVSVDIVSSNPSKTQVENNPPITGDLPIKKIQIPQKPPSSSTTSAQGASGPVGPGSGHGEGIGSGNDGGTDYTLAIIRGKIERAKRYPELAQRAGISGKSLVSFSINAEGKAENIILKESSGSPILDAEAQSTITRAGPYPTYTQSLEIWIKFEQVSN